MSKYWTLHVKDFAKIREASIEAAPLTLFVGDNNSGKSYLLSLLWGLTGGVNFSDRMSTVEQKSRIKLGEVQELLDSWKTRNDNEPAEGLNASAEFEKMWSFKPDEQSILVKGVNTFLATVKDDVINEIFNTDGICAESIRIDVPHWEDFKVGFRKQNGFVFPLVFPLAMGSHNQTGGFGFSRMSDMPNGIYDFPTDNTLGCISHYMNSALGKSIFIPAPRTGFLLTFKTLAQKSIRSTFSREPKSGDNLTSPQVSYLERLTSLRKDIDPEVISLSLRKILDFVEQSIISGKIDITDTPLPEIRYKPDGLTQTLPLYLSSGVVAEVAGFLSLLKFEQFERICIYEEPEMCLHPALQWKMARVLVKLVNAGFKVWASTHSDIIIQHINNMIKLSNYPDGEREQLQKERGYDEDDVISSDKVRMYQFDVASDHKTDVRLLGSGINGFRIPTFGRVFREMQDEVWNLRHEVKEAKQ